MSSQKDKVAVVHLVWLPYGVELFKKFIDSYIKHDAGYEHELLLIFNGVKNEKDILPYKEYINGLDVKYESIYKSTGQDINCYFEAASTVTTEYVIFLNSFSMILADNWLKKYIDHFADRGIGIIGATASCQSYYSSVFQTHPLKWEKEKGFSYNYRKYKLFAKALLYWRFLFTSFPSPHIRTNAFMVRRNEFLEIHPGNIDSKFKAYQFESGRKSLTNYYRRKNKRTLVMDKDGNTYEPVAWQNSATFWIRGQENLLISDNQTRIYDTASAEEKRSMTKLAWGI